MESDKDNDEDSKNVKEMDWGLYFSIFKSRGFTHEEILNLSYPQFNAYMNNINNPLSYAVVVPYMGGSEDKTEKLESKEELINIIADMNKEFL